MKVPHLPILGDPVKVLITVATVLAVIWLTQNVGFIQKLLTKTKLTKPIL